MCGGGGDPFQSISNTLASVDPGPTISDVGETIDKNITQPVGKGLSEADKFMTNLTPYGWALPAALLAAYLTGGGSLAADAAEAGTAAATAAGESAYSSAIAAGMTEAEATAAANAAAEASLASSSAAGGAGDVFAGYSATGSSAGTAGSQLTASEIAALNAGAGAGAGASTASSLPSLTDPSLTTQIGAPQASTGSFGSITAPATGSGAIPGAGATTLPGGGLTGALPAGTMVGDGTLGTTIGATYMSAGPGQFAVDALGNAIPATSVGIGGFDPTTGLSLSDLNNARKIAQTANNLLSSSGSGSTPSKQFLSPTAATSTMSNAADTSSATNVYGSPKGTFVHGQQVAIPGMANYDAAMQASAPTAAPAVTPLDLQLIQQAKAGGLIYKAGGGDLPMHEVRMRGKQFATYQPRSGLSLVPHLAPGGSIPEGHNPTFFSQGGLNSMENSYVKGEGDGTSDSVAAMLANGEFVIPADIVSKLGNGSNDAGAKVLDNFLVTIREHAQKHDPKELPPDSKGPLAYLLDANKKARA